MAKQKYTNNASTNLAAVFGPTDTSLTVTTGDGVKFPQIDSGSGDLCILTIQEGGVGIENVRVTVHDIEGGTPDAFTVDRIWDRTNPLSFTTAATVELRETAETFNRFLYSVPPGDFAERFINHTALNADMWYYAQDVGTDGNSIQVEHVDPGTPSQLLSVSVTGTTITVNLATDGASVITSTANDIIAAVRLKPEANRLVRVELDTGDDGTGLANAIALGALSGGIGNGAGAISIQTEDPRDGATGAARGASSIIIGNNTDAFQSRDIAIGEATACNASGVGESLALGYAARCQGASLSYMIAIGRSALAQGNYAIALGYNAQAEKNWALAIGYNILECGTDSIAIGKQAKVAIFPTEAQNSIAIGELATSNATDQVVIGRQALGGNIAGATQQVVIGTLAQAQLAGGIALGYSATAGNKGTSLGYDTTTTTEAIAIGNLADAEANGVAHIRGPIYIKKDDARTDYLKNFCGAEIVVMTGDWDLTLATPFQGGTSASDDLITMPSGTRFYPTEVGVITVTQNTVTGNPAYSFGAGGVGTELLNNTIFPSLGQTGGADFFAAASRLGITTLSVVVNTAATATTLTGRFYWKGMLVGE